MFWSYVQTDSHLHYSRDYLLIAQNCAGGWINIHTEAPIRYLTVQSWQFSHAIWPHAKYKEMEITAHYLQRRCYVPLRGTLQIAITQARDSLLMQLQDYRVFHGVPAHHVLSWWPTPKYSFQSINSLKTDWQIIEMLSKNQPSKKHSSSAP